MSQPLLILCLLLLLLLVWLNCWGIFFCNVSISYSFLSTSLQYQIAIKIIFWILISILMQKIIKKNTFWLWNIRRIQNSAQNKKYSLMVYCKVNTYVIHSGQETVHCHLHRSSLPHSFAIIALSIPPKLNILTPIIIIS